MLRFVLRSGIGVAALSIAGGADAQSQFPPPPGNLFFDYFFSDNAGQPQDNLNAFVQWNVTGGSVDLVGGNVPGAIGAPPNDPAGRYVDLGGSTGAPGRFETRLAFPVTANTTYNFTFDYRSTGGDANAAQAFVGDQTFSVARTDPTFARFSQDFTFSDAYIASSGGLARVVFQGDPLDTDNSGIGIDGVLFSQVIAAVPEPSSWTLMIGGFGLVGGALRRRAPTKAAAA